VKRIAVGILAHVDAGKTTLSEALLYRSGVIDKLGRVDKRDAYLDTHSLERERGITIFSKQAVFEYRDTAFTLIDTPGHIDFSCEAERALSVQDYAVLVVSATDGVTAHTKTLWHLLAARRIPTFIFVNKTDLSDRRRSELLAELSTLLSPACVDFTHTDTPEFYEAAAGADERLMEEYFREDGLSPDSIRAAIRGRRIFPCLFGSALKLVGVDALLDLLVDYTVMKSYPEDSFGARVYKISRDSEGRRLSYAKISGGRLSTKDTVEVHRRTGESVTEKVEEIRIYSGDKYKSVRSVESGTVCALVGLSATESGCGIGFERGDEMTLTPVLDYKIILPEGQNPYEAYMKLTVLSEEDPSLALTYEPHTHELRVRLMGEIQLEVLGRVIRERFGINAEFGEGAILYKETVAHPIRGAGHFEPLRHYAEVHLLIEPLSEGSGVISATDCDTDRLALNWQRLVMTHIEERVHRGVLVGAPLTDVKITLTAGKAHLKHTEGGDFRQATYRAVRQALMKAENILLEPTFEFRIEVPQESLGRLMNDLSSMSAEFSPPEFSGESATVSGVCPVSTMRSYPTELRAYTRGEGRAQLSVGPYVPCHNADEVIAARGYDPELDERNTPNSVFCKGGSGYAVPWHLADSLMHVTPDGRQRESTEEVESRAVPVRAKTDYRGTVEEDKELLRIFESTYGKIKPRRYSERVENSAASAKTPEKPRKEKPRGDDYVIVDGYNFIFAIPELSRAAERDISYARDLIVRMMCDYCAFHRCRGIVVFDAYKRKGGEGSVEEFGKVTVVYTKEKQTADAYIEKTTYDISGEHRVRVVTSDMQEQLVVLGAGGLRVSAREFYAELSRCALDIKEMIESIKLTK
jgi:small GTP-binding protein